MQIFKKTSNLLKFRKIENFILAISLLNNTNNLSERAVKHNSILGHHGSISLYCLVVYLLSISLYGVLQVLHNNIKMNSIRVS